MQYFNVFKRKQNNIHHYNMNIKNTLVIIGDFLLDRFKITVTLSETPVLFDEFIAVFFVYISFKFRLLQRDFHSEYNPSC